tara:strand:+ start:6643 stop:6930 length:288 start_codon:yes stop_codon:yes gene_type:complete
LASRWLVFIGCILCFTPLFPIGICLIAWYVIDLLFRNGSTLVNTGTQYIDNHYTQNIENMNVNTSNDDDSDDNNEKDKKEYPKEYMSLETREENA